MFSGRHEKRRKQEQTLYKYGGIAVLIIVLLMGYYTYSTQLPAKRVLGTWNRICRSDTGESMENLTFLEDGNYILGRETGTYSVAGNVITMINNKGCKRNVQFYYGKTAEEILDFRRHYTGAIEVERRGKRKIVVKERGK